MEVNGPATHKHRIKVIFNVWGELVFAKMAENLNLRITNPIFIGWGQSSALEDVASNFLLNIRFYLCSLPSYLLTERFIRSLFYDAKPEVNHSSHVIFFNFVHDWALFKLLPLPFSLMLHIIFQF